jgi:hypothetical protein
MSETELILYIFFLSFSNMEAFPVTIRQAIPGDEKHLVEFTKSDGWDYSEFDFKAVQFLDPDFLIVAADHSDTPVGNKSIISKIHCMCCYIVKTV